MNNLSVNEHHLRMQNKISSILNKLLNSRFLKGFSPVFNKEKNEICLNYFYPLNVVIKVTHAGCIFGSEKEKNKISVSLYMKDKFILSSETSLNVSNPRFNNIIGIIKANSEMWSEMQLLS